MRGTPSGIGMAAVMTAVALTLVIIAPESGAGQDADAPRKGPVPAGWAVTDVTVSLL